MTDAQSALAQVREALAAGPTPREWLIAGEDKSFVYSLGPRGSNAFWAHVQAAGPERISEAEKGANAKLIAACSPANMTAILAHVQAQAAEIERLRAGLRAVSDLIDESHGVAGLHRNGDVAPWSDLRAGGKYEAWLVSFDDALKEQR